MGINELKNICNDKYAQAIKLMEQNSDLNEIRLLLLDVATGLLEIGKINPLEKAVCEQKAQKLLTVVQSLRIDRDINSAYNTLTGKVLPVPEIKKSTAEQPKKPTVAQDRFTNDDAIVNSRFEWDNLPSITFSDVAGLKDVKETVKRKVLMPLSNPELYEGYVKKNGGGLLLYGPPGTGKTMIAAAIAREIGAKFCSIGVSDLVLGGLGNSEKAIDELFKEARSFPCSVIFFDEIESICPAITHAQHAREIRSELLRQIQGMDAYGKDDGHILFLIAATNKPWEIDPAFVRPGRFGTRIYVGLPDDEAREYMIKSRLNKIKERGKVKITNDLNYQQIVKRTEGFNGADISNLLDEVQEISIMRSASGGEKVINQKDFETALSKITSSAQKEDLRKLAEWQKENG